MAKYKIEFKIKIVKEYLEGNIGYKELAKKYQRKYKFSLVFGSTLWGGHHIE
ncbi:MAG: hypothetical protein ACLRU4_01480 [Peptoniphilus sp.]|uniref:hypothetical protein n=1 Tax=Peptoniphilus sp. TaxID=1971214 RepID=UPI0039A14A69